MLSRRSMLDKAQHIWHLFTRQRSCPVNYIVESVEWSVTWDGRYISQGVSRLGIDCVATHRVGSIQKAIVHCGSLGLTLQFAEIAARNQNLIVSTIFHGDFGISSKMDSQLERFLKLVPILSYVVVANGTMRERLIRWGVPESKIRQIPIGVNLSLFQPTSNTHRQSMRARFGIPETSICIGSFQKDSEGWPDGQSLKWIKGPDVFVDTVTALAKSFPVHCFLTGPSRGYVKHRLEQEGITFTHVFLERYEDIVDCYACLDLYLISSREEGGPKAVLEATACGVPVVSTRVGMVQEVLADEAVIADGPTDLLIKAQVICQNLEPAFQRAQKRATCLSAYDWSQVAQAHWHLYADLLNMSDLPDGQRV
jgi:glycosyltransferase involved in cell wall biosynthesis